MVMQSTQFSIRSTVRKSGKDSGKESDKDSTEKIGTPELITDRTQRSISLRVSRRFYAIH